MSKAKEKAPETLDELLARMTDSGLREENPLDIKWLPTGISSFDNSTGGGFPRQRICVLKGQEHSGKTLLALTLIAQTQRNGGKCAFLDCEKALTPEFAELLGVDMSQLVVDRPKTMGKAYDLLKEYARSGFFDVIVWDSATSLVPEDVLEKSATDSESRAAQARMHSSELPKIAALLHPKTCVVFINQLRVNPNPPSWMKGGVQYYTPGGKALGFWSSLTVEIKPGEVYRNGNERVGQRLRTEATKNKCSVPFRKSEFDLLYTSGLDLLTDLVDTAIRVGVIEQAGSWFFVEPVDENGEPKGDKRKYAGRVALEQGLRDDMELQADVIRMVQVVEHGEE